VRVLEWRLLKQYVDSVRVDVLFNVGDEVMLSTENLKLLSTKKLSAQYIGPFKLIKMLIPVAYDSLRNWTCLCTIPSVLCWFVEAFRVRLRKA
jgi:hypothetical protein